LVVLSSTISAQDLCVDLADPAGNFVPRGYCVTVNPGEIGDAVNIQVDELPFTVLDDPDSRLDIIVPLNPSMTASAALPITYSTSLMWPSAPVSRDSIRVRELGVNFKPDPASPRFAPLTNLMAGDDPPVTFTWVEHPTDATQVIGWTIQQQLASVPSEIGGTISHYHMTTWGLPVDTPVTFSKTVSGGEVVVPEPSAFVLLAFGVIGTIGIRQRRQERRTPDRRQTSAKKNETEGS
jgi:hypothetical protein